MLRMSDLSFLRTHQCYYERQMVVGRNDNIDATHGHRTKKLDFRFEGKFVAM